MPPRSERAEHALRRTDALELWLAQLGFSQYDRIREAIAVVREADKKVEASGRSHVPSTEFLGNEPFAVRRYMNANLDVLEFLDIYEAFKAEPAELIAPKLERALSGPFSSLDETRHNTDARNMQFELSLAAEWRLNGLRVSIGEPDFTLSAGATDFIVECKRPYWEGSVRRCIRDAKNQLESKLDKAPSIFGAIAISLTKILVPGTHALINQSMLPSVQRDPALLARALRMERGGDLSTSISRWASGIGREVLALMKRVRWSNLDFHERIVGMFFHVAPPFAVNHEGIGRLALSHIFPIGELGPAFTYLESETSAAYNRGWQTDSRGRPALRPSSKFEINGT